MLESRVIRDEELQSFFQKYEISQPQLRCRYKNQITNLCTNSSCKANALYCDDPSCPSCFDAHQTCEHVGLQVITKLIYQRASDQREFIMKLYQIEDKMIEDIQKVRAAQSMNLCLRSLEGQNRKIYEEIYVRKRNFFLEGKGAAQFLKALKDITSKNNEQERKLVEEYERETQKMCEYLSQRKNKIVHEFLGAAKEIVEKEEKQQGLLKNSKVIDKNDQESISFLLQKLSIPTKLELLFRGSENGFLSSKFHQLCDNIPNTLTLIRTQFGKTIGGYTPLTWNAAPHLNFAADSSKSSFIFSLDLKQRFHLKESEKAIYCHNEKGPCFGGGCDIYISDKCDSNSENYADFPTSYNFKEPYSNSQESYKAFSGSTDNCCFRVVEYEVYQVSWQKKKRNAEESCQIY